MTPNEYQKLAARTMPSQDPFNAGHHGAEGLGSEVQEYLEAVSDLEYLENSFASDVYWPESKKAWYDSATKQAKEHVIKELGDIWWMVAELCTANEMELANVVNVTDIPGDRRGFAGCAGEIGGYYQKTWQGHEIDKDRLWAALANMAAGLDIQAEGFDTTTEEIWKTNIKKLEARYPDGFDPERSLHRAEGDV